MIGIKRGFLVTDHLKQLISLFGVKRRHPCQHFVEDTPEGPPVARLAIEVIFGRCYNLRGQVFAGPAETARGAFARKNVFFR